MVQPLLAQFHSPYVHAEEGILTGMVRGILTGKRNGVEKQQRGMKVRQALSRLKVSLLSLQQFPTKGFSREAKGSARAHPGLWDGNLLSCLSVLQGRAQVPHCTEIFPFPLKPQPCQPRTLQNNTRQLMYFHFQDTKINYCSLRLKHLK